MNRRKSRSSRRSRGTRAYRRIGGQGAGPSVLAKNRKCARCGGPAYTRAGGLENYSCPVCNVSYIIRARGAGVPADPNDVAEMNRQFPIS
jgi:hypothetical protein